MIPVKIRPAFFLVAALIGFLNAQDVLGTCIWTLVILISVLFHEYGHALVAVMFGKQPKIELMAFGGLTFYSAENLSKFKQFLIVLSGPLFGFILFLIATFWLTFPVDGLLKGFLKLTQGINLFWTIINLLPVLPLDGGQLLRITLESFLGNRGIKYAFGISVAVAFLISLYFFLYQAFFIGALFFLLAFQSFDAFSKLKHLTPQDTSDTLKKLFTEAEEALAQGKKEEAVLLFEELKDKAKEGVLFVGAVHYLALLYEEKGESEKAYTLLKGIQEELAPDGLCLFHKLSFLHQDYDTVKKLSGPCFQDFPLPEVALRSAYAHAALHEVEPAIGWLKTVIEMGASDVDVLLNVKDLDPIRTDPEFINWKNALLSK